MAGPSVAGPPGPPSTPPACSFWQGARNLHVVARAGRGDFFREYRYEFARGFVALHDSDPFAPGQGGKAPRVLQRSLTLTPADKTRLEQSLWSACPTPADLSRSCAPGGCLRLELVGGGGPASVESDPFVRRALELFDALFPEVRSYR